MINTKKLVLLIIAIGIFFFSSVFNLYYLKNFHHYKSIADFHDIFAPDRNEADHYCSGDESEFLQRCANQNHTNYGEFCLELCSTFTPECEEAQVLSEKWGKLPVLGHNLQPYNRAYCCKMHGVMRISVLGFFSVANADPYTTAWLDHGSALGQARHNRTIIPWDDDVDIAFLVHGEKAKEEPLYEFSSVSWSETATTKWVKRLVRKLNKHASRKHRNTAIRWSFESRYRENIAVRYQLKMIVNPRKTSQFKTGIGLFGVQLYHLPSMKVGDLTLVSTNYAFTYFRKEATSEAFTYHMFPPMKCPYFDQEDVVWCPRDPVEYAKAYYGPSAMDRPKAHSDIYKWSPANKKNRNNSKTK